MLNCHFLVDLYFLTRSRTMNQLGNTSINSLHGSCKTQKPSFNLPGSGFSVACMIIFLNSIFVTNSEVKFIIINTSCFPIHSCQWTIYQRSSEVYRSTNLPGAPNDNFWKISVRKTIWDLELSEHLLLLISCLPASPRIFEPPHAHF